MSLQSRQKQVQELPLIDMQEEEYEFVKHQSFPRHVLFPWSFLWQHTLYTACSLDV